MSLLDQEDAIAIAIVQILGRNAFYNNMQVEADTSSLCRSVRYLVTQIITTAKMEPEDAKEHVAKVLESCLNMLTQTNNQ